MRKLNRDHIQLLKVLLGALTLLLLPLSGWLGSIVLFYAALICYILVVLVWFRLNRCPHCRKHLKDHTGLYCPYCGKKL